MRGCWRALGTGVATAAQDFAEHLTVAYDPNVAQDMLNALDPSRAKPLSCVAVVSGLGAVPAPQDIGLAPARTG